MPRLTSTSSCHETLLRSPREDFFWKIIRPNSSFGAPEGPLSSGVRNALVRIGQVYPGRICRRAASLKDSGPAGLGSWWSFWSLYAHLPEPWTPPCRPPPLQSAPLLSAARLLPLPLCLCPSCASRRVDCYLFTESSSSQCSFFDWATPAKLCSIIICMLVDCLLHLGLGPGKSPRPTSNAYRQQAETAGGRRASCPSAI